jgi:diacylglycerol kinase (ATP)
MKSGRFSLSERLRSFRYAFRGLWWMIRDEHNSRIHLAIVIILVPLCFLLHLSPVEWALILICIGLVLSLELLNSAIERLADKVSPERDAGIGKIKDLSAAAVLVGAVIAAITGSIIILPKIIALF